MPSRLHQPLHLPPRARALVSFPETAAFFSQWPDRGHRTSRSRRVFRIQPKPRGPAPTADHRRQPGIQRSLNRAALQSWPLFVKAGFPIRTLPTRPAPRASPKSAMPSPRQDSRAISCPSSPNMPAAFAASADLVVCRSGAGAVSNSRRRGKHSILVPFLCLRQSSDPQRPGHGRGGARMVARRRNDRRKIVRYCQPNYRGPGLHGRIRPPVCQTRRSRTRRRRFRGGRTGLTVIFSIDTCPISRNNTIRKCSLDPSTFISPELEASA